MSADPLAGYTSAPFEHDGVTHEVWRRGDGPAVVVLAEIPGITPRVVEFADRVVEAGCSVWLPVLFGTPGRAPSASYMARSTITACVSREFAAFATGRTAPVTTWLRGLAAHTHAECGGPGVGAVGMCFTGGFALGMMLDERMIAPVLSQPSLPIGLRARSRRDLHLSPDDVDVVRRRAQSGTCVLGLRFSDDPLCPAARFDALSELLGEHFIGVEIDSSQGNPWGIRHGAHSVLTEDLVTGDPHHPTAVALERVIEFLAARLVGP